MKLTISFIFQHALPCVVALAGLFATTPLRAQTLPDQSDQSGSPNRVDSQQWQHGYNGMATLSRAVGFEITDNVDLWRRRNPQRTVLVVFGAVDRLPVDPWNYIDQGGAVLIATDRGRDRAGVQLGLEFVAGPLEAIQQEHTFGGFSDCPLITDFPDEHPITSGIDRLVTNRPGAIARIPSLDPDRWQILARFPALESRVPGLYRGRRRLTRYPEFALAWEGTSGRALAIADHTIFTNQMLVHGDNARFAMNSLRWLQDGTRDTMLIVQQNRALIPPPPVEVEVEIPPPTPQEVRDAIRNMPQDVLFRFVNSVIAAAEDDNIHNEAVSLKVSELSQRDYGRLIIFMFTSVLGVLAVRYLNPWGPTSELVEGTDPDEAHQNRRRQTYRERSYAARHLLATFRAEFEPPRDLSWKQFIQRITMVRRPIETLLLRRRLKRAVKRTHPRYERYWTGKRLAHLQADLGDWRTAVREGQLQFRGT